VPAARDALPHHAARVPGWCDLVDTQDPTDYAQVIDELVNGSVTRIYAFGLQRISQNQLTAARGRPASTATMPTARALPDQRRVYRDR